MSSSYLPTVPMPPPEASPSDAGPASDGEAAVAGARPAPDPAARRGDAAPVTMIGGTDVASLSPSLLRDLVRFDGLDHGGLGWLEVLAAAVRHTQPMRIELRRPAAGAPGPAPTVVLEVHPHERLVRGAPEGDDWLDGDLSGWVPTHVASTRRLGARAPGPSWSESAPAAGPGVQPLAPLLWSVALHGARDALLPELAGLCAYRVPPFVDVVGLRVDPAQALAIERLRRETVGFADVARLDGLGETRAARLLNALYLQSALIVSRTHPAATNDDWGGYAPHPHDDDDRDSDRLDPLPDER